MGSFNMSHPGYALCVVNTFGWQKYIIQVRKGEKGAMYTMAERVPLSFTR